MRWTLVRVLLLKDLADVFRSKYVVLSLLFLPILFAIILPVMVVGLPTIVGTEGFNNPSFASLEQLSPPLTDNWDTLDREQRLLVFLNMIPLVLFLTFPSILPSVLAPETITGERERKTLESLLSTPLTDQELLIGKILSSSLPSLLIVWLSLIPYSLLVNYFTYPTLGFLLLPNVRFFLIFLFFPPLIVFGSVSLMILVSLRVKMARDAQQLSVMVLMPIVGLIIGETIGALFDYLIFVIGVILLVLSDVLLYNLVRSAFQREKLLTMT